MRGVRVCVCVSLSVCFSIDMYIYIYICRSVHECVYSFICPYLPYWGCDRIMC